MGEGLQRWTGLVVGNTIGIGRPRGDRPYDSRRDAARPRLFTDTRVEAISGDSPCGCPKPTG